MCLLTNFSTNNCYSKNWSKWQLPIKAGSNCTFWPLIEMKSKPRYKIQRLSRRAQKIKFGLVLWVSNRKYGIHGKWPCFPPISNVSVSISTFISNIKRFRMGIGYVYSQLLTHMYFSNLHRLSLYGLNTLSC